MTPRARSGRAAGVTLMELAIVIAIVAVLAVAALPSIVDRWQRETVTLLADRIASAVSVAHETAQSLHVWTSLGPQDCPQSTPRCWTLTMSPPASASNAASATQRQTLLVIPVPTVPAVQITSGFENGTLSYNTVGYSRKTNDAFQAGRIQISSGRHVRQVVINSAGRARICNPATDDDSCKLNDSNAADP